MRSYILLQLSVKFFYFHLKFITWTSVFSCLLILLWWSGSVSFTHSSDSCCSLKGSLKPERLVSPSSAQTGTLRRWASEASTRSFQTSSAERSPPESSLRTLLNRWVSSPLLRSSISEGFLRVLCEMFPECLFRIVFRKFPFKSRLFFFSCKPLDNTFTCKSV